MANGSVPNSLPDDPKALKTLIGKLVDRLVAHDQTLSSLLARIAQLQPQIAVIRRARFRRHSKRLDA